jgi:hypothetical protein
MAALVDKLVDKLVVKLVDKPVVMDALVTEDAEDKNNNISVLR